MSLAIHAFRFVSKLVNYSIQHHITVYCVLHHPLASLSLAPAALKSYIPCQGKRNQLESRYAVNRSNSNESCERGTC